MGIVSQMLAPPPNPRGAAVQMVAAAAGGAQGCRPSPPKDADNAAGCTRVVTQLVKKGVLQAQAWAPAAGDQVLAVLPEDQEWHLAVVDSASQGTQHPAIADESNGAGAGDAGVEPADLVAFAFLVDVGTGGHSLSMGGRSTWPSRTSGFSLSGGALPPPPRTSLLMEDRGTYAV
ncbi:unnamed protein product [Prorocentrum cordatum]|uniref:Subtilisin n=1 Tax=Prorocentrum cordatum TaxID=2364126 RepID=A0ABN9T343_9DINO|nr:unnamed protein product [Polarella glacialis]